ncbi:hypothetical protein K6U44_15390 [Vibrio parahaemolyticus]|uniref:hypothetical protein n=1 Tax=Vibrio parahaemolyticus TaxID=670 RepID=UPI001EEA2342|nr:hypothetical protein [Vibrio parahaemolyticus]MCG6461798.1 hypothetical protein [Vibrio parahaemolyticus]
MNRKIIFSCIALSIFTILFFLLQSSGSGKSEQVKPQVSEPKELVLTIEEPAERTQKISVEVLGEKLVKKSEVVPKGYITKDELATMQSPRFRVEMKPGEFLIKKNIAIPEDKDYDSLLLNDKETTYFYEMSDPMQVLNIDEDSNVDFVFRGSSSAVVKVIINNVHVLQVINKRDDDVENSRNLLGLIVVLNVNDILKLKAAQTVGVVSVIKSSLVNDSHPFNGDSLLYPQQRKKVYSPRKIKELRGN